MSDKATETEDNEANGPEGKSMPLLAHLVELRQRLLYAVLAFIVAFCVGYYFANDVYDFLVMPLAEIMNEVGGSKRMIYTALTEAFFVQLKVALFVGGVLSFPVFATQFWMFVAPGLYKHEKKAFLPFMVISPILFGLGAALVYYLVIPMAWRFLLGFQTAPGETVLPIELEAKVGEYLSLVMKLIFAFGISFQLPVLLTLLARVGLATSSGLKKKRKYAIVAVFAFAAVITPPDVISQIGLAIPLILLYELSIISTKMVEKRRAEVYGEDAAKSDEEIAAEVDAWEDPDEVGPAYDDDDDGMGVDDTDFNEGR